MFLAGWFRPIPVAVGVCLLVAALVVVTIAGGARRRTWAGRMLAVSVVGILAVTLPGGSPGSTEVILVPGHTIYRQLTYPDTPLGGLNVFGNVLMFLPFGWLIALVARHRRILVALIAGVLLSTAIEVTQYFVGRVSDIDDVILNSTGALLGACLSVLIGTMRSPRVDPVTRRGAEAAAASPRTSPQDPSPSA